MRVSMFTLLSLTPILVVLFPCLPAEGLTEDPLDPKRWYNHKMYRSGSQNSFMEGHCLNT